MVERTGLAEEVDRAADPGGGAGLAGAAAAGAAVAAARGRGGVEGAGRRADRARRRWIKQGRRAGRWTCACRRPRRRRCPRSPSRSGWATPTRWSGLDARRQAVSLFREALDRLGAVPNAALAEQRPGPVRHRRARRHPAAPDDRARDGVPGARGRDRDGQRHALAGHVAAAPVGGPAARAAARRRATSSARANVVNVIARSVTPLVEAANGASAGPRHRPASARSGRRACAGWARTADSSRRG